MKHSDSLAAIAPALVKAQAEMKAVLKDSTNPHFKSRYASLDAIMEAVRPALAKHGLGLVQGETEPHTNAEGTLTAVGVETLLLHASGEWVSSFVVVPVDKPTPAAAGSALTYGRRYGVSAAMAMTTDEDDDGQVASVPSIPTRTTTVMAAGRVASPAERAAAVAAAATSPHVAANKRITGRTMPFGRHKGELLATLPDEELRRTIAFCEGADPAKFKDLIQEMGAVLAMREPPLPEAPPPGDDDLPF